jgi:hypothetical protein
MAPSRDTRIKIKKKFDALEKMCSKNQFHMTRMYIAKESVSLGCKKKG